MKKIDNKKNDFIIVDLSLSRNWKRFVEVYSMQTKRLSRRTYYYSQMREVWKKSFFHRCRSSVLKRSFIIIIDIR